MVRRNFADRIAETGVNIQKEFQRIFTLFYEETIESRKSYYDKIVHCIDRRFRELPSSNRALSLEDFDNYYGYNFHDVTNPTLDDLIDICEYCFNFAYEYRELSYNRTTGRYECPRAIHYLLVEISDVIDAIGYFPVKYNKQTIFVEKSPAAVSASEVLDGDVAIETLLYNHHSMKGDLVGKRKTLAQMANWLEPKRGELKELDKDLEGTLFFLFNRCSIRHNNEEPGNHFNPQMQEISKKELEEIYDDTYQLWLLAVLTLDNKERKAKYGTMKSESKALKN